MQTLTLQLSFEWRKKKTQQLLEHVSSRLRWYDSHKDGNGHALTMRGTHWAKNGSEFSDLVNIKF